MRAGFAPPAGTTGPTLQPAAHASSSVRSSAARVAAVLLVALLFICFGPPRAGAVGAVAAAALAAVAAPQVVAGGEDDVPALAVEVLALGERRPVLQSLQKPTPQKWSDAPARPVTPGVRKPFS